MKVSSKNKLRGKKYIILFSLLIQFTLSSIAQNICLNIRDENNEPVSNAEVIVVNTQLSLFSNKEGIACFNKMDKGQYDLSLSAAGFASIVTTIIINGNSDGEFVINLISDAKQLSTVVITAQKKQEQLQKAPLSITSLNAKQINQWRLWDAKELTAIVPNLLSTNSGDNRNVTAVRGIVTTAYDPATSTYVDGINQFSLDTYISSLADIEKIEVLRGPQGTLYGRNAMGGVINITTKQPSSKTEGFAELSLGNYQQQRYNAGLRIPLIKSKLFLGISGLFNKRNGYYSNDFDGSSFDKQQTIAGNYYLKYTPRQNWIFTLNVKHQHHKNNGAFPMVLGIDESFRNPFRLNQNAIAQMHDNSVNASVTVNYSNKHFQFFSQTGWQQNYRIYNAPLDGDFSPADVVTIINNYGKAWNRVQVFTNELRLSSPAGKHNNLTWLAGLWLFHQHNPTKQSTHFGKDAGLFGVPDIDFTVTNTNIAKNKGFAFFGQASYEVSKKVTITAGLRYDNEYKQITVRGEYQKDGLSAFVTREDTSAHINFNAFSPKLGFSFKVNKSSMAFVSYTRGFRTGGLTQLSSDPATPPLFAYRPEYSNNIEVGIKNTLYNNKLLLNITLFYTNVKNSQVPTLILPDAITVIRNTGIMNSKGAEIELSTTAIKNLTVEYNMGYTDAAYKSLKISQNGNEVDLNGKKQIFTPAYTNALGVQYNYPINKIKPAFLYVRVEWMALGKQYFDFANTISQSAYSLFNAKAGVNTSKFEISAWARNISNIKYIAYTYDFGAVHLGNPITCGVTIRKSFSLKNK